MSAGGRPVGKVTVSRMKPLTSRTHSELSGKNSVCVTACTLCCTSLVVVLSDLYFVIQNCIKFLKWLSAILSAVVAG